MKKTVLIIIEDNRNPSFEAAANSEDSASIMIEAPSVQEAKDLLSKGEEAAQEAMRTWTPEPEEPKKETLEKEPEHYRVSPITKEEAEKQIKEYEATTAGNRFKRSLELSVDFRRKNESERSSLDMMQILYLANLSIVKGVYTALMSTYDLAFRKGYMTAKKQKKVKSTE